MSVSDSSFIENDSFTDPFELTTEPSSSSSEFDRTWDKTAADDHDLSFTGSMSDDSLMLITSPPGFSHFFNAFNNAAQSTRTTDQSHKRTSLLRGLFGRYSSKKRMSRSSPTKDSATADQSPPEATQLKVSENSPYYDINLHDTDRLEGLRYDFQQIKPAVDQSLSSVSDPISMPPIDLERKKAIQSAHTNMIMPQMTSNTDKSLFNANQHKYQPQTPIYRQPKPLSAVELLAKKYTSNMVPQRSTGLFWYSANHVDAPNRVPINRIKSQFYVSSSKSSESVDTSSDSDTSDESTNEATATRSSSRSSSSSSNDQSSANGQNQNSGKDLIQLDLNSTVSRSSSSSSSATSSSTSSSSLTVPTNNNHYAPKTSGLLGPMNNSTTSKFRVKRQRIEAIMNR